MDSSFVLTPTNGGSGSIYENMEVQKRQSKGTEVAVLDRPVLLITPSAVKKQQDQEPGVAPLGPRLDWTTTQLPHALPSGRRPSIIPRSIRATPFETLIHHRNLPKEGTISPLRFGDFYSADDDIDDNVPVCEITIRVPSSTHDNSTCSGNAGTALLPNCGGAEDYKSLYLSSQRELYDLRDEMAGVKEENRKLKRRLIEMQKQLYLYSRNKRQAAPSQAAWSIPHSSAPNKRHRVSLAPILEQNESVAVAAEARRTRNARPGRGLER